MRKILIVGATSAIAHATATHFANDRDRFFLVGRNRDKLRAVADDLEVRGAGQAETFEMDVNEFQRHEAMLDAATEALEGLDIVLIAHGTLPDQEACERSVEKTLEEFSTNGTSVIALLTRVANRLEKQESGTIAVISSVAGERGRQSNYIYGSAKAAVNTFLSGLRGRLHGSGVAVVTIKPGLIDTPMTADLKKTPLYTSAERAGKTIYDAIVRKKDVVYVPWYWRIIMTIIKLIPERIFKRLNLAA
ncbi:MAG: SDR family oxidoreductase [Chloroflexota bacterium]|nr:SDR family oxidoreductase [Chloroflexota bacterium]